ncbi:single-stranded DNA-binding protein [Photobacterium sp. CCB-ST2H9]|uniref:single-stranded DNA-binding protein n=1 Tax=Photobacterium sp. CCB-ST2H9 TaxID=2912855 RepID=UPI002005FA6C|nr:single-stranded DNA-binding protein [Photobacterium sp. CCB-ST2H9]UTM60123.1 single-stranded DNA-binding protein [Photobacterium sp. CCB-ST2H9]
MADTCVLANEQGFLYAVPTPITDCAGFVLISKSSYDSYLAGSQITPEDVGSAFSFGFAAILVTCYFAAYPVGIAKRLINKM